MANNHQRRRPISISTVNLDADDIIISPRAEYREIYSTEETTSSDLEKKKTRTCLITLIVILVIIVLLSIAAVIIAIYSLVLSTNKSDTIITVLTYPNISTTTDSATASTLICSSSPITTYNDSTFAPYQCLNYTTNIDLTRNADYTQSINYCDDVDPFANATSLWIRFQDPAGKVIANAPVAPGRCGTVATGWYAGQYPTAYYTTAKSIVCYFYTTNTCAACNEILVTNCKTFYVFLLPKPPSCNYRYCTL